MNSFLSNCLINFKLHKIIPVSILLLSVIQCNNTNTSSSNQCNITLDGKLQNLSGGCVVNSPSHVRVEGLNITANQNLDIYFGASSKTAMDGIKISITSNQIMIRTNNNTGTYTRNDSLVCVDIHQDEDPDHILVFEGSNCDSANATLGNSETTGDPLNGTTGNPTLGSFINYTGSAGSASVIQGKNGIFED